MTQGTIKNYLKPLRQMMKQAKVEYGLPVLHINCDDTPVPRVAARKSGRKHIFFDYDEATRFVDYCLGETPDVELYGPFFATCVLLGLRPSNEGWAIREDAINADTGEITIAAALKRAGNGAPLRIGDLKTGDSAWRRLDMPPEVSIAIKQQKATMERFGIKPADRRWDGLIFLPMNGKPPTRKTMEKHLTRICRNADVRRLPVYDLRHSCATILIENGMSYEDVAWMLGTSVTMLTEHYRHRYGDGPRGLADSWRRVRESVDDNARTR
jgi:integrase